MISRYTSLTAFVRALFPENVTWRVVPQTLLTGRRCYQQAAAVLAVGIARHAGQPGNAHTEASQAHGKGRINGVRHLSPRRGSGIELHDRTVLHAIDLGHPIS